MKSKRIMFLVFILIASFVLAGCQKVEVPVEEPEVEEPEVEEPEVEEPEVEEPVVEEPEVEEPEVEEKEPIKIGLLQDMSGPTSVLGNMVANGFKYAIEKINKEGGMGGHQVDLLAYDYKGDIQEAVNAYNRLVSDGAVVVFGPPVSNAQAALNPIVEEAKVPMLTLAGSPFLFVDEDGNTPEYVFLSQINMDDYGYTMASYAINELDMTKFGLIYDETNSYCIANVEPFVEYVESHGGEIVAEETFIKGDVDFKVQFEKVMEAEPDAIFMPNYTQNNVIAVQNRAQLGLDITILGALDHCHPFASIVNDPELADNIYLADNVSYEDSRLDVLRIPYTEDMGEPPTNKVYLGWDGALILKWVVENTGATDSEGFKEGLAQVKDVELLTAEKFTISPETHMPVDLPLVMFYLDKGEYVDLGRYLYDK